MAIWERARNAATVGVRWQFNTADARVKLHKLYPTIQLLLNTRPRRLPCGLLAGVRFCSIADSSSPIESMNPSINQVLSRAGLAMPFLVISSTPCSLSIGPS